MNLSTLSSLQKELRKRIIEISFQRDLSHIGSCLSIIDIISAIYQVKDPNDKFILSNGHAGVAWYVILEKYNKLRFSDFEEFDIHPDRNPKLGIEVSTGSLGQGLPIAVGMAYANRKKRVYCTISDGESTEGSIWEALRLAMDLKLANLVIVLNSNGWGAYDAISEEKLLKRLRGFVDKVMIVDGHNLVELKQTLKKHLAEQPTVICAKTTVEQFPFLKGQAAHYYVMNKADYFQAVELLQ